MSRPHPSDSLTGAFTALGVLLAWSLASMTIGQWLAQPVSFSCGNRDRNTINQTRPLSCEPPRSPARFDTRRG